MGKAKKGGTRPYLTGKSYRYWLIAITAVSALMLFSITVVFFIESSNEQRYQQENYERLQYNSDSFVEMLGQTDQIVRTLESVKYSMPFFAAASAEALDAMLQAPPEPGLFWLSSSNTFTENSNGHKLYSWLLAMVESSTQVNSIILYAADTGCALGNIGERFFLAHNDAELRKVFQTDVRWQYAQDATLILADGTRNGEQTLYYLRRSNNNTIILLGLSEEALCSTLFADSAGRSYKMEQVLLHLPNGGLRYANTEKNIAFLGRTWDVLGKKENIFLSNSYTVMQYTSKSPAFTLSCIMSETGATKTIGSTLFIPFVVVNALWLVLVAFLCLYILFHFNKPLENILTAISPEKSENPPQADQLLAIRNAIDNYRQHIELSQGEMEEERSQLRRAYLGKLAIDQNTYLSEEQLSLLGISSLLARYLVIVLYPDNGRWIEGEYSEQEQAYQRHVKIITVAEAMRTALMPYRTEYLTCHTRLLIVVPIETAEDEQLVRDSATQAAQSIGRELGRRIQIGICNVHEGKENFSHSYRNAMRNVASVDKNMAQRSESIQLSGLIKQNLHIADLIYVEHYSGALLCFKEVVHTLFGQQNEALRLQQVKSFVELVICMLSETNETNGAVLDDPELSSVLLLDDEERLLLAWTQAFETLERNKSSKKISHYTEQFAAIYQYMHMHFRDPFLSQSMLATEFGMTPSTLSREFQKNIGKGFLETLHQLRIETARYEIEHTNASLNDIAESVGYTNALTMNRAFKKYLGNTPGYYRSTPEEEA